MLHLAMGLFGENGGEVIFAQDSVTADGRRKCPHCDLVQPMNKLGFIRHVGHGARGRDGIWPRSSREKVVKEKENKENDTNTEEDAAEVVSEDRTDETFVLKPPRHRTDGFKASQSSDPDSEEREGHYGGMIR